MYDTILCHYDLGAGFFKRSLQTKDLDGWAYTFFLDPVGRLWEVDYTETQDFSREDPKGYVSNGLHGKVKPYFVTKSIEIYPAVWNVHWAPFPRMMLHFIDGKLNRVLV